MVDKREQRARERDRKKDEERIAQAEKRKFSSAFRVEDISPKNLKRFKRLKSICRGEREPVKGKTIEDAREEYKQIKIDEVL